MKITFIKDVENVGKAGETKEVKPGYARNFLIPGGYAILPTDPRSKEIISLANKKIQESAAKQKEADAKIAAFAGKKLNFKVKVNKQGVPYQAIHKKEIAKELGVDEDVIEAEPIKKLGTYSVKVKKGKEEAKIIIVLEKEK